MADEHDAADARALPVIAVREFATWVELRDIRLEALQVSPGSFGGNYADASKRTEAGWREMLELPDRRAFGLFDDDRVIGVTGVIPAGEPRTALLVMSYIQPAYRGRGLSKLFYDARLAWITAHPDYDRVLVGHRRSNEASRRANQRHGFVPIGVESTLWPDGVTEDLVQYELRLSD